MEAGYSHCDRQSATELLASQFVVDNYRTNKLLYFRDGRGKTDIAKRRREMQTCAHRCPEARNILIVSSRVEVLDSLVPGRYWTEHNSVKWCDFRNIVLKRNECGHFAPNSAFHWNSFFSRICISEKKAIKADSLAYNEFLHAVFRIGLHFLQNDVKCVGSLRPTHSQHFIIIKCVSCFKQLRRIYE